jgi:uncharacterized protein YegP (UPF0339 family)
MCARRLVALAALLALVVAVGLPVAALGQKDKDKKEATTGLVFEVYKDKGDHFRFRLKDGDHILAIAGKGYDSKEDVQKIIATIQKEAAKAKIIEEKAGKDK